MQREKGLVEKVGGKVKPQRSIEGFEASIPTGAILEPKPKRKKRPEL